MIENQSPAPRQMTALERYTRLEALGQWQAPGCSKREVVISFGRARLTLSDTTGAFVSQWSFAAIVETPQRDGSVELSLDNLPEEKLWVKDQALIEALRDIRRAQPGLGIRMIQNSKSWIFAVIGTLMMIVALWGALPYLAAQLASDLPAAHWIRISQMMEDTHIGSSGRSLCAAGRANDASGLTERLNLPGDGLVLYKGQDLAPHALPDGRYLVPATLVDHPFGPEVLATAILHTNHRQEDMRRIIAKTHPLMLISWFLGRVPSPEDTQKAYQTVLSESGYRPVSDLAAEAHEKNITLTPYAAYLLTIRGDDILANAISSHAITRPQASPPLLEDQKWVALQARCL